MQSLGDTGGFENFGSPDPIVLVNSVWAAGISVWRPVVSSPSHLLVVLLLLYLQGSPFLTVSLDTAVRGAMQRPHSFGCARNCSDIVSH